MCLGTAVDYRRGEVGWSTWGERWLANRSYGALDRGGWVPAFARTRRRRSPPSKPSPIEGEGLDGGERGSQGARFFGSAALRSRWFVVREDGRFANRPYQMIVSGGRGWFLHPRGHGGTRRPGSLLQALLFPSSLAYCSSLVNLMMFSLNGLTAFTRERMFVPSRSWTYTMPGLSSHWKLL